MVKNKWRLTGKNTFTTENGQEVIKHFETMIPPTNGDRTDILTECGKYYFGKTKAEFMARMSKEDYLEQTMPKVYTEDENERKALEKLRAEALKKMDWTPYKSTEQIAVIIEIKNGEITLKGK